MDEEIYGLLLSSGRERNDKQLASAIGLAIIFVAYALVRVLLLSITA